MARLVKLYYKGKPIGRAYRYSGGLTTKDKKMGYAVKTYKKPTKTRTRRTQSYALFGNNPFAGY